MTRHGCCPPGWRVATWSFASQQRQSHCAARFQLALKSRGQSGEHWQLIDGEDKSGPWMAQWAGVADTPADRPSPSRLGPPLSLIPACPARPVHPGPRSLAGGRTDSGSLAHPIRLAHPSDRVRASASALIRHAYSRSRFACSRALQVSARSDRRGPNKRIEESNAILADRDYYVFNFFREIAFFSEPFFYGLGCRV
jgi:hypothetical protein